MIAKYKKLLRHELERIADPKTKQWFEAYTKYKERYIGVKTPEVERVVTALVASPPALAVNTVRALSLSLLKSPFTEEKLAGMILYQKRLVGGSDPAWRRDLDTLKKLTEGGYISWWNTCDWLCVRVIGRIIAAKGEPAAQAVAGWIDSENLWLRRMSLVSFVNHARKGDLLFKGNTRLILDTASELVKSPERFHQTAVGWVIRELYKGDKRTASDFILQHKTFFSREGLRYATEKMPEAQRRRIMK